MAAVRAASSGKDSPGQQDLREKRRVENFPVALRVLPRRLRADLVAVYDVARVIDDLGDEAPGDRIAQLEAFSGELKVAWDGGTPAHPAVRRLLPTVRGGRVDREPFQRLIEANLQDQRITRYATYADLRAYCALSADPIGRIVLTLFGVRDPVAEELSDRVCTALQLVEHWQDVAEDRRAGRVYLPREDLVAFGVDEGELDEAAASPALRELMGFEVDRAADLLDSGVPLVRHLHGWARPAVSGFIAGGRATIDALRRAGGDVLTATARPRGSDVLRHMGILLLGKPKTGERQQ
jgi:squalene synthase HpnC